MTYIDEYREFCMQSNGSMTGGRCSMSCHYQTGAIKLEKNENRLNMIGLSHPKLSCDEKTLRPNEKFLIRLTDIDIDANPDKNELYITDGSERWIKAYVSGGQVVINGYISAEWANNISIL